MMGLMERGKRVWNDAMKILPSEQKKRCKRWLRNKEIQIAKFPFFRQTFHLNDFSLSKDFMHVRRRHSIAEAQCAEIQEANECGRQTSKPPEDKN